VEVKALGTLNLLDDTPATGVLGAATFTVSTGAAANIDVAVVMTGGVGTGVVAAFGANTLTITVEAGVGTWGALETAAEAVVIGSPTRTVAVTIAAGQAGTLIAAGGNITLDGGTDGQDGTTFGENGTGSARLNQVGWAFVNHGSGATSNIFADWDFAVADAAVNADVVLAAIHEQGYLVNSVTNLKSGNGVKSVFKMTSQPSLTAGDSNADIIAWNLLYGSPSISETNKWVRFLEGFGNGADASVFKDNAASYVELDGVTSADGANPDNYLFYRTTDSEMPTSSVDSAIVKDDNGVKVDMGRYLDVIAANSVFLGGNTRNLLNPLSPMSPIQLAGIGQVAGWYNTLPSSVATTRQSTGLLTELAYIGTNAVSRLTRKRYQVFSSRDGVYFFNRDITMGIFLSDTIRSEFLNRLTCRIVKDAIGVAAAEGRRVLGKTETVARREGLKQALEVEFAKWANPEDGRFRDLPKVAVYSSSTDNVVGKLTIALTLAVANEILEISQVISLEK
jgi:hypothetical protein